MWDSFSFVLSGFSLSQGICQADTKLHSRTAAVLKGSRSARQASRYARLRYLSRLLGTKCEFREEDWLSDLDSNQDNSLQRAVCYRYTIGQAGGNLAVVPAGCKDKTARKLLLA